jgi:hypothetical protein
MIAPYTAQSWTLRRRVCARYAVANEKTAAQPANPKMMASSIDVSSRNRRRRMTRWYCPDR